MKARLRLNSYVWSNNGEQFAQLRSLQGTWQDSVGGKITFTDTSFAPGDGLAGGKVTFVDVPQVFSWAVGPPPPSYGHGTWEVGTDFGDMMGLQNQPGAGVISIQFGSGIVGTYPVVGLEVEGPVSAPSFLCEYPDPTNTCTFRKISAPDWRKQQPGNGDKEQHGPCRQLPHELPIGWPPHEGPETHAHAAVMKGPAAPPRGLFTYQLLCFRGATSGWQRPAPRACQRSHG